MDTSETYIKMCEKAEEIRKGWKPDEGDYCAGGLGFLPLEEKRDVRMLYQIIV